MARQLTALVSANLDYPDIHREILSLLESYKNLDASRDFEVFFQPILSLLERLQREREKEEQERQIQLVKSVMNTLSYTELEVVVRIFEALGETDGILIAGKIADGLGITRSVVVSALRKLESARIIETRSLGVKGTYIKVLNPLWHREMKKLKS